MHSIAGHHISNRYLVEMASIALNCGFSDATYFIKVFKKMEEMTPLEYRNKW